MITLTIENTFVELLPNQSVSFEIQNLLLDTTYVAGSSKTFSIQIANTPTTQKIFQYAEQPATQKLNAFRSYTATLYYKGSPLFHGKFTLTGGSKLSYTGNFMFGASSLADKQGEKIADLLGWLFDTNPTTYFFSHTTVQGINDTLLNADTPVVFPEMQIGNFFYNIYKNGSYQLPTSWETSPNNHFIPCFKIVWVLEKILWRLGYALDKSFLNTYPQLAQLIFVPTTRINLVATLTGLTFNYNTGTFTYQSYGDDIVNPTLPQSILVAQYVPSNLTLKELLLFFRACFGVIFNINATHKTVSAYFVADLLTQSPDKVIDWTEKVSKQIEVQKEVFEGVTFGFTIDRNDKYLEKQPTNFVFAIQGEAVQTIDNLPADNGYRNLYTLVKQENQYYIAGYKTTYDRPVRAGYALFDYKYLEGKQRIETKLCPVPKEGLLRHNGKGGKIRAAQSTPPIVKLLIEKNQVTLSAGTITFKNTESYPTGKPFRIEFDHPTDTLVILDYTKDEDSVEWTRESEYHRDILVLDLPIDSQNNPNRIAIWWGLQQQREIPLGQPTDSTTMYPYASSDIYDTEGNTLGDFCLRWESHNGLLDRFLYPYLNLIANHKKVVAKVLLQWYELKDFVPQQLVRIRENVYFVQQLRYQIGNTVSPAEVELIRVPTNGVPIPPPIYSFQGGLKFTATSSHTVTVPVTPTFDNFKHNVTEYSISTFVSLSQYHASGEAAQLFFVGRHDYPTYIVHFLLIASPTATVVYLLQGQGGNYNHLYWSLPPINLNEVYHITILKTTSIYSWTCYFTDLQSEAPILRASTLAGGGFQYPSLFDATRINIGSLLASTYLLNGIIYDFKIFDRILTTNEITELYIKRGSKIPSSALANLIANWECNSKSGTVLIDSQNNNNGTLTNYTTAQTTQGNTQNHWTRNNGSNW